MDKYLSLSILIILFLSLSSFALANGDDHTCPVYTLSCDAMPTSGYMPLTVDFDAHAPVPFVKYKWNFDDGATTTGGLSITHTYDDAGLFHPYIIGITKYGNEIKAYCDTVTVEEPIIPIIIEGSCDVTPTSGYAPLDVDFEFVSTGESRPYTYEWIFDDGETQTTNDNGVSYTYETGEYNPTLVVSYEDVSEIFECPQISVDEFIPELECLASTTDGAVPLDVMFTAASPYMHPGTDFIDYEWDFGDGNSFSGPEGSVWHKYDALGIFHTTLQGTTERGIVVEASCPSVTVDLGNYQLYAEANGPYTGYITETLLLTAQGSYGTIVSYEWDFGDGTSAITSEPTIYHSYNNIKVYDIKLTVYDKYGFNAADTAKATVIEHYTPKPVEEDFDSGLWIGRILINGRDGVQEIIRPDDDLRVSLDLKNYYDYRINDARIIIEIPELGIKQKSSSFDLGRGASRTQSINIPMYYYDVPQGHYYMKIIVRDNEVRRVKYRDLFIQNNVFNSAGCYYNYCGGN